MITVMRQVQGVALQKEEKIDVVVEQILTEILTETVDRFIDTYQNYFPPTT